MSTITPNADRANLLFNSLMTKNKVSHPSLLRNTLTEVGFWDRVCFLTLHHSWVVAFIGAIFLSRAKIAQRILPMLPAPEVQPEENNEEPRTAGNKSIRDNIDPLPGPNTVPLPNIALVEQCASSHEKAAEANDSHDSQKLKPKTAVTYIPKTPPANPVPSAPSVQPAEISGERRRKDIMAEKFDELSAEEQTVTRIFHLGRGFFPQFVPGNKTSHEYSDEPYHRALENGEIFSSELTSEQFQFGHHLDIFKILKYTVDYTMAFKISDAIAVLQRPEKKEDDDSSVVAEIVKAVKKGYNTVKGVIHIATNNTVDFHNMPDTSAGKIAFAAGIIGANVDKPVYCVVPAEMVDADNWKKIVNTAPGFAAIMTDTLKIFEKLSRCPDAGGMLIHEKDLRTLIRFSAILPEDSPFRETLKRILVHAPTDHKRFRIGFIPNSEHEPSELRKTSDDFKNEVGPLA